MVDLFTGPGPRVFTVPPHARFLDVLARTLRAAVSGDDGDALALTDLTVLTPTRRAARELGAAFLAAAGPHPQATLLPTLQPIGDVEADEPPFEPGALAVDLPDAVSPARRRFELAALLHAKDRAKGGTGDAAGALTLADQLGRLLDEAATTPGADLARVEALYDALPEHLQDAAVFLDVVTTHWPARLAELGCVEPGVRRDALLTALAEQWRAHPPKHPVVAAGSTGANAATAALLAVIAHLPNGLVVLPGFDADLDDEGWDAIDDQHPQTAMKRLAATIGVAREDVRIWPGADEDEPAVARRRVINEALRPAAKTADWRARVAALQSRLGAETPAAAVATGLRGLSVLEAPDEEAEARAIAVMLRAEMEDPTRRALLVTPHRPVVRRVAAALSRWGVVMDASMGRPLTETGVGGFALAALAVADDPSDPVALANLLKHPLTRLGRSAEAMAAAAATVEHRALRGVRAHDGFNGWRARLEDHDAARALVDDLDEAVSALRARPPAASAVTHADAHAECLERLATTEDQAGAERVWRGPDGAGVAALLREWISEADAMPPLSRHAYARAVERLARGRPVRQTRAEDVRVRALAPLEARLQAADLVILAGLNDGVWPASPGGDPFLSRAMRAEAGLAPAERSFGLSAHDFAQLACAPRVVLTRAERADGAPTVASRWLWRLGALAAGADAGAALAPPDDWTTLARRLDTVAEPGVNRQPPPKPRPPVTARPTSLSVSRIEEWVRDPYALYARKVLRLTPLDPLDRPAGPLERGKAIHDALERVLKDKVPLDRLAERLEAETLSALRAFGLGPADLARETPRARRAAAWFTAWEARRRDEGWSPAALEVEGALTLTGSHPDFVLTARADRIDLGPGGGAVVDYKTGGLATPSQVRTGLNPQLSLEAAILAAGGFEGLAPATPAALVYVRVRGAHPPGEERRVDTELSAAELADEALARLRAHVARYADPNTPYGSRLSPFKEREHRDFDRLARRKEWGARADEAGGTQRYLDARS